MNSPITIASVRNAPRARRRGCSEGSPAGASSRQLAPRLCDASVSVCTSIERKPASSEKNMYGNARITYAADEEAVRACRGTRTGVQRVLVELEQADDEHDRRHDERHERHEARSPAAASAASGAPSRSSARRAARLTTIVSSASMNESLSVVPELRVVDDHAVVRARLQHVARSALLLRLKRSVAISGIRKYAAAEQRARSTADGAIRGCFIFAHLDARRCSGM